MKLINMERNENSMVAIYKNEDITKVFCWFSDDVLIAGPVEDIDDIEIIELDSMQDVAGRFVEEVDEDVPYTILGDVLHLYLDPFYRKCQWIDVIKLMSSFSETHYLEDMTVSQVYTDCTGKRKTSIFKECESTAHGKIMYALQELEMIGEIVTAFNECKGGYFNV